MFPPHLSKIVVVEARQTGKTTCGQQWLRVECRGGVPDRDCKIYLASKNELIVWRSTGEVETLK